MAQNRIQVIFKLPSNLSYGSVDCHFVFDYRFEKYFIGNDAYMRVKINITGTPTHSGGDYKYRYNGTEYNHNVLSQVDGLAMSGFTDVILKNADFMIYVQGERYQMTLRFEQVLGYANLMKVSNDTDPSKFTLSIHSLENVACSNTQGVERRINNYLSSQKKGGDYKNYISNGDRAFQGQDWGNAKYNYQQALNLFPNEQYPKSQLEKINNELNKKNTADANNTNNSSSNSSSNTSNNSSSTTTSSNTSNQSDTRSSNSYSSNSGSDDYQSRTMNSTNNSNHMSQQEFEQKVLNNAPANLNYKWDPNRSSADIMSEGINNVAGLLGNMAEQNRIDRERRDAERRQQQEAERIQRLKIQNRKAALMNFKEGSLPMSLSNVNGNTIYYFFISYDSSQVSDEYQRIYISNVFPVMRYSDDTWPSKSTIQKEINDLTPRREILIGWFDYNSDAEESRKKFITDFTYYDGSIREVKYEGKTNNEESTINEDFWESDKKEAPAKPNTPQQNQLKQNSFWDE